MRAIWTGAVSFGLVNVPVRLYTATSNHDIRFHQVHERDGGRIRYQRICTVCGEEVDYADIVKGYETEDGQLVMIDDEDLASLPVVTSREIDVVEFVPADQVDPLLLDKSYYLEPENKAVKPYTLLREALRATDRMAVVKVALRQRETLALLRVRDKAIVLQTMLWPDEVREPDFETLRSDVELRPQELAMASSLVDSLGADFDPTAFEDSYQAAMVALIDFKRENGQGRPALSEPPREAGEGITDLLTALRRSVEAAGGRTPAQEAAPQTAAAQAGAAQAGAAQAGAAQTGAAQAGAAQAATPRTGARKAAAKTPAAKAPAAKAPAAKAPAKKAAPKTAATKTAGESPAKKSTGTTTTRATTAKRATKAATAKTAKTAKATGTEDPQPTQRTARR